MYGCGKLCINCNEYSERLLLSNVASVGIIFNSGTFALANISLASILSTYGACSFPQVSFRMKLVLHSLKYASSLDHMTYWSMLIAILLSEATLLCIAPLLGVLAPWVYHCWRSPAKRAWWRWTVKNGSSTKQIIDITIRVFAKATAAGLLALDFAVCDRA